MTDDVLILTCQRGCGEVEPAVYWQSISPALRHLRADCPHCGRWIKWLDQKRWSHLVAEMMGTK